MDRIIYNGNLYKLNSVGYDVVGNRYSVRFTICKIYQNIRKANKAYKVSTSDFTIFISVNTPLVFGQE